MKEPTLRGRLDPSRFAIAPEALAEPPEPESTPTAAIPDGWFDPASAPRDGTMIEVAEAEFAYWRITRRRDPAARRWVTVGYWANATTRDDIGSITRWRMPEGFNAPGMVA